MLVPGPDDSLADAVAKAAHAFDSVEPLRFVRHVGDDDLYSRGSVAFVLPGIWTKMPPDLLALMRARRSCSAFGRCPSCDACIDLASGVWAHEYKCPISDDRLCPILSQWARRVGLVRGHRICELPTPGTFVDLGA